MKLNITFKKKIIPPEAGSGGATVAPEQEAACFVNQSMVEIKREKIAQALQLLTSEIQKKNCPISLYVKAQEKLNSGFICPFPGLAPPPALDKYLNNCFFTIGKSWKHS